MCDKLLDSEARLLSVQLLSYPAAPHRLCLTLGPWLWAMMWRLPGQHSATPPCQLSRH